MYCPKCKNEYFEGKTKCPECKSTLVENSNEGYDVIEAMKPVKVTSTSNSIESGIILNLLQNNDIPCFKKDVSIGGYMNLYMGYSVYGEDIYVDESDYQKALDIISVLSPELDSEEVNESIEGEIESTPVYKTPRNVIRIIIGIQVVLAILIYILTKQ